MSKMKQKVWMCVAMVALASLHLHQTKLTTAGPLQSSETSKASTANNNNNTLKDAALSAWLPGDKFCFYHVGKTAGTKIACEVGLEKPRLCPQTRHRLVNSTLRHRAGGGRIHIWVGRCPVSMHHAVVSLRDPLDRIVSWYHYEIHGGKQDHSCVSKMNWCFPDFNAMAENLTAPADGATPCQRHAWSIVRGERYCIQHNRFNFRHYDQAMQTWQREHDAADQNNNNDTSHRRPAHVWALRSEFLAADWNTLEALVGGERNTHQGETLFETVINFNGKAKRNSTSLSDLAWQRLCHAMCPEIQVYKRLLSVSENLTPRNVQDSIRYLQRRCPNEPAQMRECPS